MIPDWRTVQILHEQRINENLNPQPSSARRLVLWSMPKIGKFIHRLIHRRKVKQQTYYPMKQQREDIC